jgi:nitroreductase
MSQDFEHIKCAPVESGVDPLLLHRWIPRAFSEKSVSTDVLTRIFTAASWAASSKGEHPWRFLVGRKGDPAYQKIFDCLVEANQAWAGAAPVLLLSVPSRYFAQNNH